MCAGRLDEAEKILNEALAINHDLEHMRLTSLSKLATVYLAQGNSQRALAIANEVWQVVEQIQGRGLPFPIKTMFECYTIFTAYGDARAKDALTQAAEVLQRTANGIEDPELRASFLERVPAHRELTQLWEGCEG